MDKKGENMGEDKTKDRYCLRDYASEDFPLFLLCPKNADTRLHDHDFTELVIVVTGHGVHFTDEDEYELDAGDVFVIPPFMKHGYRAPKAMNLLNFMFDFNRIVLPHGDLAGLPGFHALFDVEPKFRKSHRFRSRMRLNRENLDTIQKDALKLQEELEGGQPGCRSAALGLFMWILVGVSRAVSKGGGDEPYRQVHSLSHVISHLERNYAKRMLLEDLAGLAGMSSRNLSRYFKKATGSSPMDYLMGLRITHAKELLRQSDFPVSEIAARTGFSDGNFFARQFKSFTDRTPREFRKLDKSR
jgi:AraC-like DNA-binding protein/mannose-6-phosphate isomerase-like protein (cupin superfamily)